MFEIKSRHIMELESYHPDYQANAPTWRTIADLIDGYTAIKRNITKYLPLRPGEDAELYALRSAKLAYTPLLSGIVNRYAGKLASSEVVVEASIDRRLQAFRESNGLPGQLKRNEKALISDIFRHLLQYARAWVTVDTNVLEYEPQTEYDESLLGAQLQPYCYLLDPLNVTQWGEGWHVERKWVQTVAPFQSPSYRMVYTYHDRHQLVEYTAEVLLEYAPDEESNLVPKVKRVKIGDEWLIRTDPKCVIQPSRVVTKKTPIYSTVSLILPSEQWLCKQLYSKQIQHLQLETSWTDSGYLAGTIQRVFTPVPAPPMEDARTPYEVPDYTRELQKAGNSHIMVAANYQFVESAGTAIANQQGQLDKIEEQINALAALHFASSKVGTLQQSGASKRADMSLLDDTLKDYGDHVINLYNSILSLVSSYLGIEPIEVAGLDEFDSLQLEGVVSLLQTVGTQPQLPSAMLQALYNKLMELAKIDLQVNDLTIDSTATPPTE